MIDIFQFEEYREFLRAYYEKAKENNSNFSYRFIAQKIGFKSSFLSRLFKKETHLALDKITPFAELMKLNAKESLYFEALVRLGRAKSEEERSKCLEQVKVAKGVLFTTIQQDEEAFFGAFYHMVIRSILGITPCTPGDYRRIAGMVIPRISTAQARESVELLQRLNLVELNSDGFFVVTNNYISTSEKWSTQAIHEYQMHNIKLSGEALENLKKEERDISTVTFTIDRNRLPELREKLNTFREDMLRFSEEGINDNEVMHLNLQLFPVARIPEDSK